MNGKVGRVYLNLTYHPTVVDHFNVCNPDNEQEIKRTIEDILSQVDPGCSDIEYESVPSMPSKAGYLKYYQS